MKSRLLSIGTWTCLLAAAGVGGWLAMRPAPVPCDFGVVDRGPLVVTVEEDGRTRLKDRYVVSAPLTGRAERISLKPGDPVTAVTTVLTRIAPTAPALLDERARAEAEARVRVLEAAAARAEPELARAEAEVAHVQAEYERFHAAAETKAVSVQEVENELVMLRTNEQSRNAARFTLQVVKYELEQARAALLQHTGEAADAGAAFEVRSPITGKVLRVIRESAGVVTPGEPLIELGSLDALEVELDVLSDQAVKVRPGQRVSLERWGGEKPLAGVVRVIEPSGFMKVSALGVEEQRVNVIIDFIDPPEVRAALGDNFRVEARITVWESPQALRVPVGALFRHGEGWAVYVAEAGRAALRPVTIGQRSSQLAEVLGGLEAGERIIVFPSDRVAEGVRVLARGGAAAAK